MQENKPIRTRPIGNQTRGWVVYGGAKDLWAGESRRQSLGAELWGKSQDHERHPVTRAQKAKARTKAETHSFTPSLRLRAPSSNLPAFASGYRRCTSKVLPQGAVLRWSLDENSWVSHLPSQANLRRRCIRPWLMRRMAANPKLGSSLCSEPNKSRPCRWPRQAWMRSLVWRGLAILQHPRAIARTGRGGGVGTEGVAICGDSANRMFAQKSPPSPGWNRARP